MAKQETEKQRRDWVWPPSARRKKLLELIEALREDRKSLEPAAIARKIREIDSAIAEFERLLVTLGARLVPGLDRER